MEERRSGRSCVLLVPFAVQYFVITYVALFEIEVHVQLLYICTYKLRLITGFGRDNIV